MKLILTSAALLLSLLAFAPTAAAQSCSCDAPDSSCHNVEVTCSGGCGAICGPKDACYAACGNFESDLLHVRVTLTTNGGDANEVTSQLKRQTDKVIEFLPRKPKDTFNLDLKGFPLFSVLDILSKRGVVKVNGTDFRKFQKLRTLMLKGGRVYIKLNDVTVQEALDKLTVVTGRPFRVKSGDATAPISLSLKAATYRDIAASISRQSGVKIAWRKPRRSRP